MGNICTKEQDNNVPQEKKNIMSRAEWNEQKDLLEKKNIESKKQHEED